MLTNSDGSHRAETAHSYGWWSSSQITNMKTRKNILGSMGLAFVFSILPAQAVVLTFEGVGDLASINEFYNGGTDSAGNSGTNYGISFNTDALGLVDGDAGGSGNIGGEPSPDTVMFFLTGSSIMNVAAGFDTGFSFFYSKPGSGDSGIINVFDGLGGTGTLLGSFILPTTPDTGAPDPTGRFSPLVPIGISFDGTAQSVEFAGTANFIVFDDVTLGSETPGETDPVPDSGSTALLLGLGLLGFRGVRRFLA
jgi:hypothetical protein